MATLKNTDINDTGFLEVPRGTTSQRPTSPVAGAFRYNTEYNLLEYFDGSGWRAEDGYVRATGSGYQDESTGNYNIYTFLGSGSINIIHGGTVEVLVVAGGGSGGYYVGGGGGGGGYIEQAITVSSGSYQVVVGGGGNGARDRPASAAMKGDDSSVFGLTAVGGGGGGSYNGYVGGEGGSSGGQGAPHTTQTPNRTLANPRGQGNDGGAFVNVRSGTPCNGSGGGGAGGQGDDALNGGSLTPAHGGAGRKSWVCPFGYYYAGGGGGGFYHSSTSTGLPGDGGVGGGGGGGHSSSADATMQGYGGQGGFSRNPGGMGNTGDPIDGGVGGANTGGGSGGAGHFASGDNATGGSGIVIVRWLKDKRVIRNG